MSRCKHTSREDEGKKPEEAVIVPVRRKDNTLDYRVEEDKKRRKHTRSLIVTRLFRTAATACQVKRDAIERSLPLSLTILSIIS